ncbi:Uma2 family endonuclease [Nocardiopsis sp. NPDC006832]|uniref:Uma2 family endonuclease n=1 Tax=Nocardiopsis sp. NPDC006832 TaxID=3157188 RepID=UPI00340A3299
MAIAEAESESAVDMPSHWEVVLRAWEELDLPEGWRAEIIEGAISIMTPPKDEHARIIALINKWIIKEILREGSAIGEAEVHQNIDVRVPMRSGLYIPDLVVLPGSIMMRSAEHSAEDALLLVEVTSQSTAKMDRKPKLWGYAHAGVPLYLLVDRWDPDGGGGEITLFSDPENGRYTSITKVPFGKEIHLPEPFDLTLDTGEFPL